MSDVDLTRQTSRNKPFQPCFSTCLTVKGTAESRRVSALKEKRDKNESLRMWAPMKSVVVKTPDLEVKGTCLVLDDKNRVTGTVGVTSPPELIFSEGQNSSLVSNEVPTDRQDCEEDTQNGDDTSRGNMLFDLLKSSLNKKPHPEYINIIPSQLKYLSAGCKSPQFGNCSTSNFRLSPRPAIKHKILPSELKFGIRNPRNPKKANCTKGLIHSVPLERPKTVLSSYQRRLKPLLPREKPAENLHEEVEREEARARKESVKRFTCQSLRDRFQFQQ